MGKSGALPLETHRHSCPWVWEGPVVLLLLSVQTHSWSLILVLPVHPWVVYFKQFTLNMRAIGIDSLK